VGCGRREGPDLPPHLLFGYNSSMRDGLVSAITLDTFHRHADKVAMANVAQLVNCIQSLSIAYEDKLWVTPDYHGFDLYKEHQNGQTVRAVFGAPAAPRKAPGRSGSASLKGKTLVLTFSHTPRDQGTCDGGFGSRSEDRICAGRHLGGVRLYRLTTAKPGPSR
jgi:alpha-L-arabinofuranosidase